MDAISTPPVTGDSAPHRASTATRRAASTERDPGVWPRTNRVLPWLAAAFLLMLWLVPFDSITAPFSVGVSSKLDRVALVLMFGAWIVIGAAGGRHGPRFRRSPMNVAILFFVVVAFTSIAVRLPVLSNLDEVVPTVKQLALLLSYFGLFYFVATVVRPQEVRHFLNLMLALACLSAIGTVWEYRGHGNLFYTWSAALLKGFSVQTPNGGSRFGRAAIVGPTESPLADAAILSIALSFALVYLIHARDRRGKVIWFLASALLLAGTLSTQRKSAVIIPLGAVIVLLIYKPRQMIRFVPAFLGLLAAIYAISPRAISGIRYQFLDIGTSASTVARTNDYTAITPDILAHPILGRGYGSYAPHVYRILDNQYLGLLVEMGFVGLAAYLLIMLTGGALAHRAARSRDPSRAMAGVALMGAIAGFVIANATFDVLAFAQVPYMLMFVLALTVVAADRSHADESPATAAAELGAPGAQRATIPPHPRRARVSRPPRRPVDVPRRPAAPRSPAPASSGEGHSRRVAGRWPGRIRGEHGRRPAHAARMAATLGATAIAIAVAFVVTPVPRAHPVPLVARRSAPAHSGPSANYGPLLNHVIRNLNAVRLSAGAQLAMAHGPTAQALAARRLAKAHRQAAAAFVHLDAPSARAADASLAKALQRVGEAYAKLASAAAQRDPRAYGAARAALTRADRALNSAFAQRDKLGYRVA